MTKEEMIPAAHDLVYLAGCSIQSITPDRDRVEEMDLEAVYQFASFLNLSAVSYMAIEPLQLEDAPVLRAWAEKEARAVRKAAMFSLELQEVMDWLESAGIWYMPLKGIVLQDLYPRIGMRQMCDIDILYDGDHQEQVHDWFLSRGYEVREYQKGNVDSYMKEPFYNVEMHHDFFAYGIDPAWNVYFKDMLAHRLLPAEDGTCRRHLSDEDFYLYIMTHMCKHVTHGGTSLRSLLDHYLFLQQAGGHLDWAYIEDGTRELGIADLESRIRPLSRKVFTDPASFRAEDLTPEELRLLDSFLLNGTYGTRENRISLRLQELVPEGEAPTKRTALRYIWQRFFPGMDLIRNSYPFYYQHKWLLPVWFVYRMTYKGIVNRKALWEDLKILHRICG